MAEFDDKLNSLLSNPDAMSQIMQLAQSLGGGGPQTAASPQQEPAWNSPPPPNPQGQSGPGPGWSPQGQSGSGPGWSPQGQSGSGPGWNPQGQSGSGPGWSPQGQSGPGPGWSPQGQSGSGPGWNPQMQNGPPPAGDILSSLTGGLDPKLISKFLPLIQELGGQRDSNARNLLYALRPYLKAERQDKIERALQLARLFHLGRKFLSGWGGPGNV